MNKSDVKTKTIYYYDFFKIVDEVNEKLGYNQRNAGRHFHLNAMGFNEWCDFKNYGEEDSEGKHRGISQIWWSEYTQDINDGTIIEVPYYDFWHTQLDICIDEHMYNGAIVDVYVGLDKYKTRGMNHWQLEIHKVWNDVCKDIMNIGGYVTCKVEW